MGIKDILSRALHKDGRLKEMQKEMQMQKMAEDRLKNSNERELEKYMEEERQKQIKEQLEHFRKARQEETWHGNNMFMTKDNMFKGKATMLNQDKSVMDNGRGILNDKKLFKMGKSKQCKKGGMFFK